MRRGGNNLRIWAFTMLRLRWKVRFVAGKPSSSQAAATQPARRPCSFPRAPAWKENKRQPGPLETSLPNIFAAGDVRSGSVKRCAAAVGEGGMAVAGVQEALAASANRT